MRSALFALCLVGSAGCSVDVGNLFGNDGAGGAGTGGAGVTNANATGDTSNAVTTGDGVTTTGATTSVTTGGPTTTTTGGNTTASTGTGTTTGARVFCHGNNECDPGEVCCYNYADADLDHCGAQGTCGSGDEWLEIRCNGPADCPNGDCCGSFDGQVWTDVQCKQQCGGNDTVMCYGDPGACNGGQCSPSQLLGPGYAYCPG